ncbi:MAG: cytochrome b N-terminal domain-containing protein [Acidimicrobiia bacterium]|nr:cytochrome b N-terminal domain-containing protein [Acidimicrobiia bacterium]MDH3396194.1 cytochrome b N-terminal domain-containing protein [Acidimicrobiia bacterium]
MGSRLGSWVDERLGWPSAIRRTLRQTVPRLSWGHVLGSATLASLIILILTGILLSFSYVPSPDQAHATVEYITAEVPFGAFIRNLHHFGASALVVLSIAHLVRVVVHGAHKYPREFTWFTGVVLLLLVFAAGFTGSLLPWDQNAFWATAVRMQVIRVIPGIGDRLAGLLMGGNELSAVSLVRFFIAHVGVIPALIVTVVVVHLRLVHNHGISGVPDRGE